MWDSLLVKLSRSFECLGSKSLHSSFDCCGAPWYLLALGIVPANASNACLSPSFLVSCQMQTYQYRFFLLLSNSCQYIFWPFYKCFWRLTCCEDRGNFFSAFLKINGFHRNFMASLLSILNLIQYERCFHLFYKLLKHMARKVMLYVCLLL